jgi:hypothetical protein
MLEISFPALNVGTYDPHFGAKCLERCRLIHSDVAYEVEPEVVWAILISQCRDNKIKEKRKAIFGGSSTSSTEQTLCIPLLQPWSIHYHKTMYRAEGNEHAVRPALFPAFALRENCVWEFTFRPMSHFTSGVTGTEAIGQVKLLWEELVCSPATLEQIKKANPNSVCAADYTILRAQTASTVEKAFDVTAVMSRAPVHNIWIQGKLNTDASRDPFNRLQDELESYELEGDGRILLSDKDESQATRDYLQQIRGKPTMSDEQPQCPCVTLGNDSGYSAATARQQLSNTSLNTCTLRLDFSAPCSFDIVCESQISYSVVNGTLQNQNVY